MLSVNTTSVGWNGLASDVPLTDIYWPLLTVELALVYGPPSILYVPSEIEIFTSAVIPDTVIVFDVYSVERAAFDTSVKLKLSGSKSGGGVRV